MSTTNGDTNKSSAQLEREVESTRAGLAQSLDDLRENASPGRLFEQALDYAKTSGGADFTRNLGSAVRDNPLPLLLIGAGIGWLMMSGNQSGRRQDRYNGADWSDDADANLAYVGTGNADFAVGSEGYDDGTESDVAGLGKSHASEEGGSRIADTAGRVRDAASGAVSDAASSARSAYDAASSRTRSAAGGLRQTARDTGNRLSDMAQHSRDSVGHYAAGAQDSIGGMVRDQPLVLGALGLAVGAAIGAMIPETDAENRLMGETRDEIANKGKETAQRGFEHVKSRLGEHASKAGDQVSGSGEVLSRAREGVRDLASDLKSDLVKATESDTPRSEPAPSTRPASPHISGSL